MQKDLEKSLEVLTEKAEQNWIDFLEKDFQGNYTALQKFQKFKEEMISMKNILENHFNAAYESIKSDLAEVAPEMGKVTSKDYTFDGTDIGEWTCVICKEVC